MLIKNWKKRRIIERNRADLLRIASIRLNAVPLAVIANSPKDDVRLGET